MAHIDLKSHSNPDHAHVCAAARTWRALAITALVWAGIAPALVLGALVLIEAAIPRARHELVAQSSLTPAPAGLRASGPPLRQLSNACTPVQPAPCATD